MICTPWYKEGRGAVTWLLVPTPSSVFFHFQLFFQASPRLGVFRAELALHSTLNDHAASSSPVGPLSPVTPLEADSVPSQGRAAAPRWHLSSQHREAAGFMCFTERICEERHLRFPALSVTPGTAVGQWTDDGEERCTLLMKAWRGQGLRPFNRNPLSLIPPLLFVP